MRSALRHGTGPAACHGAANAAGWGDDARPIEETVMSVHDRAGSRARPEDLVDVPALLAAYADLHPDPSVTAQRVAFGTSGHRGSALNATFNDDHIAATSQAICEYREQEGTDGPLYLGRDSHAL